MVNFVRTDISETNYTATIVESSNIYYEEVNDLIQSDSGGICNTLGNDSMCDSKQKSSYEHVSDFERLPRYGKKKIRAILRA